jgi:hypothetical protein
MEVVATRRHIQVRELHAVQIQNITRGEDMTWKIVPANGGWWLLYQGTSDNVWLHAFYNKWLTVFPTLDDVFQTIKERT